jgi:hypothetical protein
MMFKIKIYCSEIRLMFLTGTNDSNTTMRKDFNRENLTVRQYILNSNVRKAFNQEILHTDSTLLEFQKENYKKRKKMCTLSYPICKSLLQRHRMATHRSSCHWKFGFQLSFFQFLYICC